MQRSSSKSRPPAQHTAMRPVSLEQREQEVEQLEMRSETCWTMEGFVHHCKNCGFILDKAGSQLNILYREKIWSIFILKGSLVLLLWE